MPFDWIYAHDFLHINQGAPPDHQSPHKSQIAQDSYPLTISENEQQMEVITEEKKLEEVLGNDPLSIEYKRSKGVCAVGIDEHSIESNMSAASPARALASFLRASKNTATR